MSQGAGCTVEEGHTVIKKEARAAGAACQAARGAAGASGQAPFDSLLWTAGGGGHCSLPDVSGAGSSHPGD